MTRRWKPFGRALAGLCLALTVSACAEPFGSGLIMAPGWPPKTSLNDDGKAGTGEGKPSDGTEQPAFVGLYQTSEGPLLYKDAKLFSLSASGLKEWGKAPRAGMAWSLVTLSPQEAWSVGAEGIAHYRSQIWEPVVNASNPLLAPSANNGLQIRLMDVAFADAKLGFAVGSHGTVLQYADQEWRRISLPGATRKHFGTVRVASAKDVWVAGETLMRYDGDTWTEISLPKAGARVNGLVLLPDAVWASTGDALWRWDRSAGAWDPTPYAVPGYLGAPQLVPGNTPEVMAWAMDTEAPGGRLFQLKPSGSWTAFMPKTPPDVVLDSLVVQDARTLYALSYDASALYKFDQDAWSRIPF